MSATPPSPHEGSPTRSEIENWDTSDLDNAATRWRLLAARSEELFAQHRHNISTAGGTDWSGDARDAALDRINSDMRVVHHQGVTQREAANIAEDGSRDIQTAKHDVLNAIAAAEADGFRVDENLSVTDTRRADISTIAARHTSRQEHAEDIRWNTEHLLQADAYLGERLQAKADELEGIRFTDDDSQPPRSD